MQKNVSEFITPINGFNIIQRNDFQHFTIDSVLLANFVKINRKTKKILDIGTGCGIIPILLSKKTKALITGIEIQDIMAEVSLRNVKNNNVDRIKIICGDIKNYKMLFSESIFDVIVTNPPYFEYKGDKNQINDSYEKAIARHNFELSFQNIFESVKYLLKNKGSFFIVCRSDRMVETCNLLSQYKLEPKKIKFVYTSPKDMKKIFENRADHNTYSHPKICLIEAIKDGEKGVIVENPIFVYNEKGVKSDFIKNLYSIK